MYWLAVSDGGPGTYLTDWANDGFLGDGWHLWGTMHKAQTPADAKEKLWYDGMDWEEATGAFAPYAANVEKWQAAYTAAYDAKKGEGAYGKDLAAFNEKAAKAFRPGADGEAFEPAAFEILDEDLAKTVKAEVWLEDEESGEIRTGDVGYIISGIKTSREVRVGDTITHVSNPASEGIAGFEEVKPMVFAGVYPIDSEDSWGCSTWRSCRSDWIASSIWT